jgi:hypothetical protein
MTTDHPDQLPADAPEADYVEQHQPAVPGAVEDLEDPEGPGVPLVVDPDVEANPADVLEQAEVVPIDDEDDERA